MRWIAWMCLTTLAVSPASQAVAQSAEFPWTEGLQTMAQPVVQAEPWIDGNEVLPAESVSLAAVETDVPVEAVDTGVSVDDSPPANIVVNDDATPIAASVRALDAFLGYRHSRDSMLWIIGDGDQAGMFSLFGDHYQKMGEETGVDVGTSFHFLGGPERTDMPPRVFDFSIGFQSRKQLGDFSYDVATAVVASSDFEGSARRGIRFPSHAVGYLRLCSELELVFGVDYLDRGDIKLLPVGGVILHPNAATRLELVFPRPRITVALTPDCRLYCSGELGGGTWAIEREPDPRSNDLATYRDLRLSIGIETYDDEGEWSAIEIGYLFDRRLEYTSGIGDYSPNDTAIIRLVHGY